FSWPRSLKNPRQDEKDLIEFQTFRLSKIMNKNFFPVVALILSAGAINAVVAQTNKSMMKAIVIHQYGGPEALQYEDAPRPEPKDNQVLVEVIAPAVNPVGAMIRSGKYAKVFGTTL